MSDAISISELNGDNLIQRAQSARLPTGDLLNRMTSAAPTRQTACGNQITVDFNPNDVCAGNGNAAIIYFYTRAVPASEALAVEILSNPIYTGVITPISVDNVQVRNYLLYSNLNVNITDVPVFVVAVDCKYKVISVNDKNKVLSTAGGGDVIIGNGDRDTSISLA